MKKQNGKFQYLYDDLRTKIENHIFMPEDKLPSETQLIEQYGISRYMVRQVLEKLEEEKLIDRYQGKGCFVRSSSYTLSAPPSSKQILLVASRAENFYFLKSINGIEQALQSTDYSLTIKLSNYSPEVEADLLKEAFHSNYAGILLFPSDSSYIYTNQFLYRYIEANRIPCITLGNVIPFVNIPSVVTDDYKGGKLAAEHLIARGHTSFVCLMNREEYSGCMRYAGFIDGINCAGLSPSSCTVFWFTHQNKDSIFLDPENQKLLELARNTSSFFCFNDASAVNLYRLLTASGFRIPDNISIIGYDDSYLCETLPVQLTSLHQDPHLTGYTAAKNLLQLIKDPNYNYNRTFDPYLVVRDSVK